jgi:serine/threonine protein kinase
MNPDREHIKDLLGQVSDGDSIDWDAVVQGIDPTERAVAEALRDLDRIGNYNRSLQRTAMLGDEPVDAAGEASRWGDLLLLERQGVGSSADVWRAWDPQLRREVALKLVRPGGGGGGADAEHALLLAEGRALARVRHPHVVTVHGIDVHDGRIGLRMELVRGETLEHAISASGPLSPAEAVRLGREIGGALGAVHAAGLLHRDVKPANIVRDADGRWVLADFGLGRALSAPGGGTNRPPGIAGSPMYMAPELLLGGGPDVRTDVYALGLLVWYALAGAHPFPEGSLEELRAAAATGPRPSLATRRAGLPQPLVETVERAIAPAASLRCATAHEFVAALGTGEPARPRSRRRAAWLAGTAVAVAGLLVLLAVSRTGPRRDGAIPAGAYAVEASLLRHGAGAPTSVADGDRVSPGDRLSLRWRASRKLWVYVLNADDRGEAYLLFPQPGFAASNPLPADAAVELPGSMDGGEVAWTVTSAGGRETFLIVASPEPVAELEGSAAGLGKPEAGRPVQYAAAPAGAIARLRGVGGLSPASPSAGAGAEAGSPLARFRALAGRETGVTGVWVREIVLTNPD